MSSDTPSTSQKCSELVLSSRKRKRLPPRFTVIDCPICHAQRVQNEFRNVRIWSDKLLVLLAALNLKEIDIVEARRLSSSATVFFICPGHILTTCNQLFIMLNVKSPAEVPKADKELVQKAMNTVFAFKTGLECLPIVSDWHFLQICYNFLVKNWHASANIPLPVNGTVRYYYPTKPRDITKNTQCCRICDEVKHPRVSRHLKTRIEKLMVLIWAVHQSKIAVKLANHLYSLTTFLSCSKHVPDAANHLMNHLKIAAPCVIPIADKTEIENVMTLISEISKNSLPISETVFLQQSMLFCEHHWTGFFRPQKQSFMTNSDLRGEILNSCEIRVGHEEEVNAVEKMVKEEEEDDDNEFVDVVTVPGESYPYNASEPADFIHSAFSPSSPPFLPTCRICSKHSETLQFVSLRADKLVLLLCSILKREISQEVARELFFSGTLAVCHGHFPDSLHNLLKVLGVPDEKGLFSASEDEKAAQNLLELANYVRSNKIQLTEARLLLLCSQFYEKYRMGKPLRPVEKHSMPTCHLCGIRRKEEDVTKISAFSEKMIVLVTEVTRGGMAKTLARQYFGQLDELLVCQWHLTDVCKKLCTMFRVPRPEAFRTPKKHLVDHVMGLVADIQKGKFPSATTDSKYFVQQCQRFTSKYWKPIGKEN